MKAQYKTKVLVVRLLQLIKFKPDIPAMPIEHENGNKVPVQLQKECNVENALPGK